MGKNRKGEVIQKEFNVKEIWHYNISVLMNHYQDQEKMILSEIQNEEGDYIYRERGRLSFNQ